MAFFLSFSSEDDKIKFEYLYEKYKRLLYKKAYEIVRDNALAEDAVSEAYFRVYKNLGKIDDPASGKSAAFLVVIVKNAALTILKKRKDQTKEIDDIDIPYNADIELKLISKERIDELGKLVGQLSENLRQPFLLSYVYDMPYKRIAELLNLSETAVTVRIHRARKKLANLIEKEAGI